MRCSPNPYRTNFAGDIAVVAGLMLAAPVVVLMLLVCAVLYRAGRYVPTRASKTEGGLL